MKFYKEIRFCKICNKKFFANGDRKFGQYYCEDCYKKYKQPEVDKR